MQHRDGSNIDSAGIPNAQSVQLMAATNGLKDFDICFERYMEMVGFDEIGHAAEMKMVKTNTES